MERWIDLLVGGHRSTPLTCIQLLPCCSRLIESCSALHSFFFFWAVSLVLSPRPALSFLSQPCADLTAAIQQRRSWSWCVVCCVTTLLAYCSNFISFETSWKLLVLCNQYSEISQLSEQRLHKWLFIIPAQRCFEMVVFWIFLKTEKEIHGFLPTLRYPVAGNIDFCMNWS